MQPQQLFLLVRPAAGAPRRWCRRGRVDPEPCGAAAYRLRAKGVLGRLLSSGRREPGDAMQAESGGADHRCPRELLPAGTRARLGKNLKSPGHLTLSATGTLDAAKTRHGSRPSAHDPHHQAARPARLHVHRRPLPGLGRTTGNRRDHSAERAQQRAAASVACLQRPLVLRRRILPAQPHPAQL
jgi:hypothetical protein